MKSSGDDRQAGLAQLEERGSHNPEVVSSSLTTRILFVSFIHSSFYGTNQRLGNCHFDKVDYKQGRISRKDASGW